MDDYLEDDYRPAYETWQQNQTPEGNATFLREIDPIVQKGIQLYGSGSPLAASKGRLLALQAARKYNPQRSRLQSHMLTQMQGLRRLQRKQHQVIRVPERVLLENQRLQESTQELTDGLGREPTDNELADKLGLSLARIAKIRQYQPGMSSGQAAARDPEGGGVASRLPGRQPAEQLWLDIVYDDLGPLDQKIMELSLGMHGQTPVSNQEIARRLSRSPGAISQRKIRIQQLLDQEQDLSPFLAD